MTPKLVTDEMREQIRNRIEHLKAKNPRTLVEAWWDGDSLFTGTPKIKTSIQPLKEKNTQGEEHMKDPEQQFIDDWNAGKVRRVHDGAKPWVGLHTTTILDIYTETLKTHRGGPMPDGQIAFAKAIEQALKERNTCI